MSRPEGARGRGLSRGCRGVGQRRRRPGSAPRRRGRTTVEGEGRASATGVRTGQRGTGFAPPARRACRPPPVRRSPDKGRQPRGLPAWRASPSGPSCPARARAAALLPSWCWTFVPPPCRRCSMLITCRSGSRPAWRLARCPFAGRRCWAHGPGVTRPAGDGLPILGAPANRSERAGAAAASSTWPASESGSTRWWIRPSWHAAIKTADATAAPWSSHLQY